MVSDSFTVHQKKNKSTLEMMLTMSDDTDLVTYCEREGVPFTLFEDWSSILATTKDIYSGKVSLKKVAEDGRKTARQEGAL